MINLVIKEKCNIMKRKGRKEWDEILQNENKSEEESEEEVVEYFSLTELLKSFLCVSLVISVGIIFLVRYLSNKDFEFLDIFTVHYVELIIAFITMLLFSRPLVIFVLSTMDAGDDFEMVLAFIVIFVFIVIIPLILLYLLIYHIMLIRENLLRPRL